MFDKLFGRSKRTEDKPPAQKPDLKIGIVASQTGPLANYAANALRGFELGLEYATQGSNTVSGRAIRLLVEDDAGYPDKSELKAKALVEIEKVDVLQGCTSSGASIKLARAAQEHKRVLMVAIAATGVLTGEWFTRYLFRTAANTFQDAAAGGKDAAALGRKFCFFSPDHVWGQQSRSAWWQVIEQHGGQIVGDVLAAPDEQNFHPYLKNIMAREPDVLIPSWAGTPVANLFNQMKEDGLVGKIKVAGNLVDRETLISGGKVLEGMVCAVKYHYTFPKNAVNDWLVQRHQEKFKEPPDLLVESGFTSAVALVQGLTRTDGDADPEGLIPVLEGMRFEGPKGAYTFRPDDHQALQPMYSARLVPHPTEPYCVPELIREVSAEETTPPVVKPR